MGNIIDVVMRLTDRVTDPLRNIRRQMEQTANANRRLGRDIQSIGQGVSSIGQSMMPAAAAITAVTAATGKTFMDFEATVTGAAVKAGAKTKDEFNKMRDVAGKLGAEFPITASQAAAGMDRLAAGGFDVNETIGAMPGIITAAVASGEDLAVTSDVITSALSIWNMKNGDIATNTTHVADVVQMAANQSKLGMQDFGLAMQYAGAPAAALGVSIEELGTAMAIMSNNGINASTIGTSLRATMSRLASPPKQAAAAIDRLGLKIKDANGNFVGFENVISQMRTAMQGMSNVEKVELAKMIGGEDAYSGLLALIETTPEAYAKMTNKLNGATGESAKAYRLMQDTVKGSIDAMMGSVEAFGIAMGTVMSPYIREAAETVKYFANTLTDMGPEQQKMLALVAGSVVGFTAFTLAAGKLITIGGALVTMYGELGTVMAGGHIRNKLLEYSIRGVQAAYSGLGSIAAQSMTALGSAGTTAGGVFDVVKQKATALRAMSWADVGTGIKDGFTNAGNAVKRAMGSALAGTINMMTRVSACAVDAATSMRRFAASLSLSELAGRAAAGIKNVGAAFLSAAKAGLAFAVSPIGIALIAIAGAAYLIYKNWDKVGPFFVSLWNRIKAAFAGAMQSLKPQIDRLKAAFEVLKTTVGAIVVAAFERLKTAFETVKNAMNQNQGTINALIGVLTTVATIVGGVVVGALVIMANIFTGVVTTAINIAASVIDGFIQVLTGLMKIITGVFAADWKTAWEGIKDIFSGVFDAIAGICSSVMDGIRSSVGGAIDSIKSLLGMANGASVTVTTTSGNIQANAEGGIYAQGAFLTTFAEKSPEAAIPINNTPRAIALWRKTGEMLGVMPKVDNINMDIKQAPVDLSAGFRTLADSLDGGSVTNNNQTVINQAVRSQQGTPAASNRDRKQEINISVNMGNVTIKNDDGKDLKTMGRELAGEILFNIQKNVINANVGAV